MIRVGFVVTAIAVIAVVVVAVVAHDAVLLGCLWPGDIDPLVRQTQGVFWFWRKLRFEFRRSMLSACTANAENIRSRITQWLGVEVRSRTKIVVVRKKQ